MDSKVIALLVALVTTPLHAATIYGPSPYLSEADSPFVALIGTSDFYLENFEDGSLNTPGVSDTGNGAPFAPSSVTDSVDADDGSIDGSGNGGHSYWTAGSINFQFDPGTLGGLPTYAGLVVTHTQGTLDFIFRDGGSNILHTFSLSVPSSPNGETSNDRFIGVFSEGGIGSISVAGNLELDHLQYGVAAVPVPAAVWLFGSALGLFGFLRKRKANA